MIGEPTGSVLSASILPVESEASGLLHHVELWVPDLERGEGSMGMAARRTRLPAVPGLASRTLLASRRDLPGHRTVTRHVCRRARPAPPRPETSGLPRRSTQRVDALTTSAPLHGWTLLFADRHPHAGGEDHYAAYLANTDGYEVELIADRLYPPEAAEL